MTMRYHKIHAYVRVHRLELVEQALERLDIGGFSYCRVKGIGEYANYFRKDLVVEHARLEIFVREENLDAAIEAIITAAGTHSEGDGILAVLPVEQVIRIRDHTTLSDDAHRAPKSDESDEKPSAQD